MATIKASPEAQTLTIELPPAARIPEVLNDTRYTRYLLAAALYTRGDLSGAEARSLTGDDRRTFEETMAQYGFPLMPDDTETIAHELNGGL